jgi:hypothetical protein
MRHLIVLALISAVTLPTAGCGGKLTQADMRRNAIHRSQDDEESAPPTAAGKHQQDALQEAAQGGHASDPARRAPSAAAPAAHQRSAGSAAHASTADSAAAPAAPRTPAKSAPQPAVSAGPPTPPAARPTQPLSPIQRRQKTLDNLARIGEAVRRYTGEKKQVFPSASYDALERPLLSWRVELLPYLGYDELYRQFQLDQPWDSPTNQVLLAQIPEVYQSPERFDETTNYLVFQASFTPFSRRPRGVSLSSVEDGPANTVAIVEADDEAAVPWTKPADLELSLEMLRTRVGHLRGDGFFVVWLDGAVSRVAPDCGMVDLKAAFTGDAGDSFAAHVVYARATAEPAAATPPKGSEERSISDAMPRDAENVAAKVPDSHEPAADRPAAAGRAGQALRLPVPDPVSVEQARKLVRELYQAEYESQSVAQQSAVAQKMIKQAGVMKDDPAGQYVLLDVALKIATRVGDASTAIAAAEKLAETFAVDDLDLLRDTLGALAKKGRDHSASALMLAKARSLIDKAIRDEQFDVAADLCQIALAAARQRGDRQAASQLVSQTAFVEDCQKAQKNVQRILKSASDADDADGNLRVGQYYCFVRDQWEKGLPLLAQGSHARLRELAETDLAIPVTPTDQLKLADGWWELGTSDQAHQAALYRRAAHWYQMALPRLSQGLLRAKAEMRLKECERLYGSIAKTAAGGESSRPASAE